MEQFLTYELAPQPPSLLLDSAMRKPIKRALSNLLNSCVPIRTNLPNTAHFVRDGGHLLQTVVWSQPSTYRAVCDCYVAYNLSIMALYYDENMQTTTSQTAFLANSHNKSRLIVMLNGLLNDVDVQTSQSPAHADTLIVSTALSVAESPKTVIVVGTDTDLLVMLVHLSAPNMDLHMICSRNPFIL